MNAGWLTMPFSDAVADESGGNEKTPQSEFLPEGRFAVVDQGKELVAGYVDDQSRLCRSELPVIVFGDHTRYFKYVDFPFCMGADGVKVLRPKFEVSVKYLYYYLRQLRLTDGGYDRHFKYLKRCDVVIPPLAEQRRIAAVLDRAEALRAKRRAALAQLDTLTQSIFLDLFGDPATNPKDLRIELLGEHLLFVTSGSRGWAEFYAPTGSRFIRSFDVQMNYIGDDDPVFVLPPDNAEAKRTRVRANDVLLTITGSRIGRVAPVTRAFDGAYISQHVAILRASPESVEPTFLSFFLSFEAGGQRQITKFQYGQTKPGLNFEQIRRFQVPVPPLSLQREFARRVVAVENLKAAQCASLSQLDALFAVLQHRAFRGEL
jgi:type I restriction enzyme S subunit